MSGEPVPEERSGDLGKRRRRFWRLHDLSTGRGLELGPLHRPIATRETTDVRYLDVQDLAGIQAHYANDPGVNTALIPHIDYFLLQPDGRTLSVREAAEPGAPYDWVVASHVIEHIPDVIGWLGELGDLVRDGGRLVLAVPDKRFTFDIHRPTTTVGQMIAAHDAGDAIPSVRAVYDHFDGAANVNSEQAWRGTVPSWRQDLHPRDLTAAMVGRARDGHYVDCHVWLWTPELFLHQMNELRLLGLSPWYVDQLRPTEQDRDEFHVTLRRLPRDPGADAPADELLPPVDHPDWLEGDELAREGRWPDSRHAQLERRLERANAREARVRKKLARARRDAEAARADLERLRSKPGLRHVARLVRWARPRH